MVACCKSGWVPHSSRRHSSWPTSTNSNRLARCSSASKTLAAARPTPAEEVQRRESQSEALWQLARILREQNNAAAADRLEEKRTALWKDRSPAELAALALKQTTTAGLIGYGKTPVTPAAQAVRKLDLDQAAANLRLAVKRGFRDLHKLESHPDFELLRARDDVKRLVMDMTLPDRPIPNE